MSVPNDMADRLRESVTQIGDVLDLLEAWRADLVAVLQRSCDDLVHAAQAQANGDDTFKPLPLVAEHFNEQVTAKRDLVTSLLSELDAAWRNLDRLELDVALGR